MRRPSSPTPIVPQSTALSSRVVADALPHVPRSSPRTDFGVEKKMSLEGMDEKAVEKQIASMLK